LALGVFCGTANGSAFEVLRLGTPIFLTSGQTIAILFQVISSRQGRPLAAGIARAQSQAPI
jgi:mannose/fructose-specific phosphotransferase system component IIA